MELFDYLVFNFAQQNEKTVELLTELLETIDDKLTLEEHLKLIKALYYAKGYTLYVVKTMSEELGFTKTKVKYLVKQLIEEEKAEIVVVDEITFIKPLF